MPDCHIERLNGSVVAEVSQQAMVVPAPIEPSAQTGRMEVPASNGTQIFAKFVAFFRCYALLLNYGMFVVQ